jgi:uncharacterized protein (TIGR03086 family)
MTMSRIDLHPAAAELSRLVEGTRDDQLSGPTPLDDTPVEALLAHIARFSQAFAAAASKTPYGDGGPPPTFSDEHLPPDWRTAIPRQLAELAVAWANQAAWEGTTSAGGVEASAAEIGVVALDELVVHGWDLARATGQSFSCDATSTTAVLTFTKANATAHVFYSVRALTIAHLMRRQAEQAGLDMSVRELLHELSGIQETVLLYHDGGKGPPPSTTPPHRHEPRAAPTRRTVQHQTLRTDPLTARWVIRPTPPTAAATSGNYTKIKLARKLRLGPVS